MQCFSKFVPAIPLCMVYLLEIQYHRDAFWGDDVWCQETLCDPDWVIGLFLVLRSWETAWFDCA